MRILPMLLFVASCAVEAVPEAVPEAGPDTSNTIQALNGDTWTTVDNDPFTAGSGVQFNGIAISPTTHTVVVAGWRDGTAASGWTVMRSTNGTSYALADNFHVGATSGDGSYASNVAVDASGRFYAIGYAFDANGLMHAIIRRSTNDGVTWTTVFDNASHVNMELLGITVDSAGRIFTSGVTLDGPPTVVTAVVLRSTNQGTTWTQVHTLTSGDLDDLTEFAGMCSGRYRNLPAVYAVGYYTPFETTQYTIAQVSTDGGTTWTTAFRNAYLDGSAGTGCAGTASGSHVIFTGTDVDDGGSQYHAVDFDSTALTWTDDVVYSPSQFHSQANGAIFVANRAYSFGDWWHVNGNWKARFSTDNGASWLDAESWHYAGATGDDTSARGAANDPVRGFLIVGTAQDPAGRYHGIVRHRDAP